MAKMPKQFKKLAAFLGPGLITAALVLGPGSVAVLSKTGALYGYQLLWLPIFTGILMVAYATMSAKIGLAGATTLLGHVRFQYGRWLSIVMGVAAFAVCCCFQAADNTGVAISTQTIFGDYFPQVNDVLMIRIFSAGFTVLAVVLLFSAPNLYKALARIMTALVLMMIVCFLANLFPAKPDFGAAVRGLTPSLHKEQLSLAVPMVATTFSVIAALYQAYLIQSKEEKSKNGNWEALDALAGIGILTFLSTVIMMTAAAVLNPKGIKINNAGEMARQLEPLLGSSAKYLFSFGLWGASFSSLVANAIVGGGLLADGLGFGGDMSRKSVRICTTIILLIGALVAHFGAMEKLNLIIIAQATTVIFVPLCALVLLLLANNRKVIGEHRNGPLLNVLGLAGLLVVSALSVYSVHKFIVE
jgi:Mn2+/Fe2+ NRAMP family transporter